MSIAEQIKEFHKSNLLALMEEATERACSVDQDWDNESTIFIFADNSALTVCGSYVSSAGSYK